MKQSALCNTRVKKKKIKQSKRPHLNSESDYRLNEEEPEKRPKPYGALLESKHVLRSAEGNGGTTDKS